MSFFQVPSFTPDQAAIPFARVNHNKYMVTEKVAYIGKFLPNCSRRPNPEERINIKPDDRKMANGPKMQKK